MSNLNIIPEMTDPLGAYWDQPERQRIEIDDTHALMTEVELKKLIDYSNSTPSGVYEGKMWKRLNSGAWFLMWFSESDIPDNFTVNWREIIIA